MWPNPQSADLVTFNEEILNGKLHFLCSVNEILLTYWIVVGGVALFFFFVYFTIFTQIIGKTDISFKINNNKNILW